MLLNVRRHRPHTTRTRSTRQLPFVLSKPLISHNGSGSDEFHLVLIVIQSTASHSKVFVYPHTTHSGRARSPSGPLLFSSIAPRVNLTQKAAIFVQPLPLSPHFTLPHESFRRERLMLPKHRLLLLNQLRQVCATEEDYVCCLHKVCGDVDGKSRLQSQVQLLLHRRQI